MNGERSRPGARGIAVWPWALAAAAVAAQSAAHLGNVLLLDGRYRALNAASDASVFGRANSIAIGACAALVGLAAWRGRRRFSRLLLCACLIAVTADDITGYHDHVHRTPSMRGVLLALVFASILAATLALLAKEAILADRPERLLLVVGLAALIAAVLVRVVVAASGLSTNVHGTAKAVGIACEQGLDFGGWLLVAAGLFGIVVAEARQSAEVLRGDNPAGAGFQRGPDAEGDLGQRVAGGV